MTKPESRDDWYRIGAVARLTGVPPVTLRAWERRYGAVTTVRQEGRARMYSREDVERLVNPLFGRRVKLDEGVAERITAKTGGNPALIHSYCRALLRRSPRHNRRHITLADVDALGGTGEKGSVHTRP